MSLPAAVEPEGDPRPAEGADAKGVEDSSIHIARLIRVATSALAMEEAAAEEPMDAAALARVDHELDVLLVEAGSCLPDDLLEELGHLVAPLQHPGRTPDEVRVGLGLLVGWITGVMGTVPTT